MPVLDDLSSAPLGRAVEENLSSLWPSWSVWDGVTYEEGGSWRRLFSRVAHPAFNHLFALDLDGGNPGDTIDEALAAFRERHLPCFCWLDPATARRHDSLLDSRGLAFLFAAPGMAADLEQIVPPPEKPRGLVVREVASASDLADWCAVVSEVSEFPQAAATAWHELHRAVPFGAGTARRHFIGFLDGEPAGTSSLLFAGGVAGLYSVTVPPKVRRRGIGTALSLTALAAARQQGCRAAVLAATAAGTGIYRRLGFREYRRWECRLLRTF